MLYVFVWAKRFFENVPVYFVKQYVVIQRTFIAQIYQQTLRKLVNNIVILSLCDYGRYLVG